LTVISLVFRHKRAERREEGLMSKKKVEILLVEDDENDIRLATEALSAWGEQLCVTRDGEEALEFLAECQAESGTQNGNMPKLILLDLKLPRMSGHEVLRQIKKSSATQRIPVVVLTSSDQDDDLSTAHAYGANSYIKKPMTFEEFRRSLKNLCSYWIGSDPVPTEGQNPGAYLPLTAVEGVFLL
jgi:two-component system response regulator